MWSVVSVWNMRTHTHRNSSPYKELNNKKQYFAPFHLALRVIFTSLTTYNVDKTIKAWVSPVSMKSKALSHSNIRDICRFVFELCRLGRCWDCSSSLEIFMVVGGELRSYGILWHVTIKYFPDFSSYCSFETSTADYPEIYSNSSRSHSRVNKLVLTISKDSSILKKKKSRFSFNIKMDFYNLCICFVISPNVSCCFSHVFHLCCCYSSGIPCFNSPSFATI